MATDLMKQLAETRRHLRAVLAAVAELGVDSESWVCRGCGDQMIGRCPADDHCRDRVEQPGVEL